jgi:hypothetical protein
VKPTQLDKQSVLDAACMLIGSAIGASATVAFVIHRWMLKEHHGAPAKPGEPQR